MAKLRFDVRLIDVRAELPALRDSVATLENQLKFLSDQRRKQVFADLPPAAEEAEVHLALQELHYEVEYTYPRIYRGALLVVIWAAYESALLQVAEFIRAKQKLAVGLSDVRGRGVLEQANTYFPKVLNFPLHGPKDSAGQIGQLLVLRNAFAHAAGRVAGLRSERQRKTIRVLEAAGWVEEELGYWVPTQKGLASALHLVDGEVSNLIERALTWDDARRRDGGA